MRKEASGPDKDDLLKDGLLHGLEPYHIRVLCDDPWNGGRGFQGDPGDLTLDQMFMRLTDRKVLKAKSDKKGVKTAPLNLIGNTSEDGTIQGRAKDGEKIQGRIGGKSVARQLMEVEAKKEQRAKQKQRRRRRKGG